MPLPVHLAACLKAIARKFADADASLCFLRPSLGSFIHSCPQKGVSMEDEKKINEEQEPSFAPIDEHEKSDVTQMQDESAEPQDLPAQELAWGFGSRDAVSPTEPKKEKKSRDKHV